MKASKIVAVFAVVFTVLALCQVTAAQPGTPDSSFDSGAGADGIVEKIQVLADGRILMAGYFTSIDGVPRKGIARLLSNGDLDPTFDPGAGANKGLLSFSLQSDGKVIVGGEFTDFDGVPRNRIARLNQQGKVDATFDPGTGVTGTSTPAVLALAVQNDDKIIIGGSFTNVDGTPRTYVARLNANGQLDTTFSPGFTSHSGNGVFAVHPLAGGQVLVGGLFSQVDGVGRNALVRLNGNGSLDASFNPRFGAFNMILDIATQTDGALIVAGVFNEVGGTQLWNIARLRPNGDLDPTFNPGASTDNQINCVLVQPDGKIYIGGYFTNFNGVARNRIARLNTNGSLDTAFDPGTGVTGGADPGVFSVALQADGNLLIAGDFTQYNGVPQAGVSRATGSPQPNLAPTLPLISDRSVNEGSTLTFALAASDPNPGQTLIYTFDLGSSTGATLSPNSGVFSWTPSEAQGPGAYMFIVRVTDNGSPPMSDTKTFTVGVNEVNTPPSLDSIPDQTIEAGRTLTLTARATDSDLPQQLLTFSLATSAPAGATIDARSGQLIWAVPLGEAGQIRTIIYRVTDSATPSFTEEKSFRVNVTAAPVFEIVSVIASTPGKVLISWRSQTQRVYQVQANDTLGSSNWQDVSTAVIANGPVTSVEDSIQGTAKFYRVRLVQ